MMNIEQKTIFAKLAEIKRDIERNYAYNYTKNSFAESEQLDLFETFYDVDKTQPYKVFWHNHKTGACGYREYTKEGPEKQTMDYYPDGQLITCYYQKGICLEETGYKNGVLNGFYIRELEDKSIEQGSYTNGKRNPTTIKTEFYTNGMLKEQTHYYNGIKDGESFTYYPNGKRHEEMMFYDGMKVLGYKCYHPNGLLKEESFYSNGRKDGFSTTYREDGTKMTEAHYKNGVLDGAYLEYDECERLMKRSYYKAGRLNGISETYDKDGTILSKEIYTNGQKITPPAMALSKRLKGLTKPVIENPEMPFVLSSHLKNGSR